MGGENTSNSLLYTVDLITVATPGNATDWGANLTSRRIYGGACGNSARSLFAGGYGVPLGQSTNSSLTSIDYLTLSNSSSNASDFGDLTEYRLHCGATSNGTYGLFAGGLVNTPVSAKHQSIDYVTIDTASNGSDFGDLVDNVWWYIDGCANETRATFSGGDYFTEGSPGTLTGNVIQYVTIATPGNAIDFGDLTGNRRQHTSTSGAAS